MSTFGISHFIQSCNSGGRLSRLGSKSLFFCQTVFTPEHRKCFVFAVGLMVYFRAFNVSVTCNPESSPVCGKGADHSTASQAQHTSVMPCMALQEAVCTAQCQLRAAPPVKLYFKLIPHVCPWISAISKHAFEAPMEQIFP